MQSVSQSSSRCDVRSKHEDISLVPVEQFYKEASEEISKPVSRICLNVSVCARSFSSGSDVGPDVR